MKLWALRWSNDSCATASCPQRFPAQCVMVAFSWPWRHYGKEAESAHNPTTYRLVPARQVSHAARHLVGSIRLVARALLGRQLQGCESAAQGREPSTQTTRGAAHGGDAHQVVIGM